jgi:hypothetical protein
VRGCRWRPARRPSWSICWATELCSAPSCSAYAMRGKQCSRVAHQAFLRFGFQVLPRLDGIGSDHLAALVRIRRTRHRGGFTAVDRARLSSTRAAVAKRGHRGRYESLPPPRPYRALSMGVPQLATYTSPRIDLDQYQNSHGIFILYPYRLKTIETRPRPNSKVHISQGGTRNAQLHNRAPVASSSSQGLTQRTGSLLERV